MSEKNNFSATMIVCLLLAASAMGTIAVKHKHVTASCTDLRVAMDGGYSAVLKTGGITPSSELTIYQLRNRKRVKMGTVEVMAGVTKDGFPLYQGEGVRLLIGKSPQKPSQRHLASIDGELNGSKVSATLSCEK